MKPLSSMSNVSRNQEMSAVGKMDLQTLKSHLWESANILRGSIDASDWMSTPKLSVIETKKGSLRSSNFVLTTSQSSPKSEEEEGDK